MYNDHAASFERLYVKRLTTKSRELMTDWPRTVSNVTHRTSRWVIILMSVITGLIIAEIVKRCCSCRHNEFDNWLVYKYLLWRRSVTNLVGGVQANSSPLQSSFLSLSWTLQGVWGARSPAAKHFWCNLYSQTAFSLYYVRRKLRKARKNCTKTNTN